MTSLRDVLQSARSQLPAPQRAQWASILFSLSVVSFQISLAAAQGFLAAAALVYILHLARDRPVVRFPPVKLPLVLFCLTTLVSVSGAENPTVGWFAVRKLTLFLILPLGANLVVSDRHLIVLYEALFVESAITGLVGARQFVALYQRARALHPEQVYFYMSIERIRGFMGHWMNFGGQQMIIFAALLAFVLLGFVSPNAGPANEGAALPTPQVPGCSAESAAPSSASPSPTSWRWWWVVLGIVTLSLVLNFTRGVWLGCLAATVYLVGCWRPRWLWLLPALVAVGLVASPRLIRQRLYSLGNPSADPSVSIRLEMWQAGLRMIRKHPWLGVGPNNIPEVYTLYLPPGKAPEVGYREHLHNDFIQLGAERGLPCLAAWVWFMGALGWHFRITRRKTVRLRWVADAASAALLAMLVEGCFEFNFGASPVLMLFLFVASTPSAVKWLSKAEG